MCVVARAETGNRNSLQPRDYIRIGLSFLFKHYIYLYIYTVYICITTPQHCSFDFQNGFRKRHRIIFYPWQYGTIRLCVKTVSAGASAEGREAQQEARGVAATGRLVSAS